MLCLLACIQPQQHCQHAPLPFAGSDSSSPMHTACCARQHMLKHWCKLHTEMPASSQLSSIAKQQTQQLNWAYPKTKLKQNPWQAPHKNEGHPPAAVHSTTQVENACCRRHSVLGLSPVSCSKKVTSRPCAAQHQNKSSATSQPAQPGYKSTGARPWEVCVPSPAATWCRATVLGVSNQCHLHFKNV